MEVDMRETLLHKAANSGNYEEAAELLRSDFNDIDKQDLNRRTALMHAAASGHSDIVKLLLAYGASVHKKDRWGRTALTYACKNYYMQNDYAVLAQLVLKGAETNLKDKMGVKPIEYIPDWLFSRKSVRLLFIHPGVYLRRHPELQAEIERPLS